MPACIDPSEPTTTVFVPHSWTTNPLPENAGPLGVETVPAAAPPPPFDPSDPLALAPVDGAFESPVPGTSKTPPHATDPNATSPTTVLQVTIFVTSAVRNSESRANDGNAVKLAD
jgi:hypothetical protein